MGNLLCSDDNRIQVDQEEGAQKDIEPPKEVDVKIIERWSSDNLKIFLFFENIG